MLDISERIHEQTLIINLRGRVDHSGFISFRRVILRALQENYEHLIFDFSQVLGIDSSGLGMLLWAAHTMNRSGGLTTILNPSPPIKNLFSALNLPATVQLSNLENLPASIGS